MFAISNFFLQRKILVKIIIILTFALGIKAISFIPKEGFPEVISNLAIITTNVPGASAEEVEIDVTIPLEEALSEVSSIEKYVSISRDSISNITVTINQNANDKQLERIFSDIEQVVNSVKDLPSLVDGKPIVELLSSSDVPILEIALQGSYEELKNTIPKIKKELLMLNSVAAVDIVGLEDEELHILVDAKKALENQIDIKLIEQAILNRNNRASGGKFHDGKQEFEIIIDSKYQSDDDLLDTNIRISDNGKGVKLKDIATVKYLPKDVNLIVRNNGERGASILIKKVAGSDVIKTIDSVKKLLKKFNLGDKVTFLNDGSNFTRNRIKVTAGNAIVGFIIIIALLFFLLDKQTAIWAGFGIPFSLFATCLVFLLMGIKLNVLALGGFIIVIGMVVDDAVVITERISFYREKGMNSYEAIRNAINDVWKPVTAATVTTIIAFTPLLSFGGNPGKFVWIIPFTIILVLIFSLVEAFTILPTHLSNIKFAGNRKKLFLFLENKYRKALNIVLARRYITILVFISLLAITIACAKLFMVKDIFPAKAAEIFNIKIELPTNITLDKSEEFIKKIENYIQNSLTKDELIGFSSRIGTQSEMTDSSYGFENNLGIIFIYLTEYLERNRTAKEIIKDLKNNLPSDVLQYLEFSIMSMGPPIGYHYEIIASSGNNHELMYEVNQITELLKNQDGIISVNNDYNNNYPQYKITIKHDLLHSAGITEKEVANIIRASGEGKIITNNVKNGKIIDYRLKIVSDDKNFLDRLFILNKSNELVKLTNFLDLQEVKTQSEIKHFNGIKSVKIYGYLNRKIMTSDKIVDLVLKNFPTSNNVDISFEGEIRENNIVFKNMGIAALAAIMGIYFVIAFIFNSFSIAFIIIAILPFLLIGIILAIFAHGEPISFFVMLAMIGTTGVVVNGAIVMIYAMLPQISNREFIIHQAVIRLRPIILTNITTILSLIPAAYAISGYDPFISQMSLGFIYGLLFGIIIVLFLLPCLIMVWNDLRKLFIKAA